MEPARELSLRITQHWRGAGDAGRAGLWGIVAARWLSVRNFVTAIEQCRTAIADLNRAGRDDPQLRRAGARARPMLIRPAQFGSVVSAELEVADADAGQPAPARDIHGPASPGDPDDP